MCHVFQALGVFGLCQIYAFVEYLRSHLSREQFGILFRSLVLITSVLAFGAAAVATALGSILCSVGYREMGDLLKTLTKSSYKDAQDFAFQKLADCIVSFMDYYPSVCTSAYVCLQSK